MTPQILSEKKHDSHITFLTNLSHKHPNDSPSFLCLLPLAPLPPPSCSSRSSASYHSPPLPSHSQRAGLQPRIGQDWLFLHGRISRVQSCSIRLPTQKLIIWCFQLEAGILVIDCINNLKLLNTMALRRALIGVQQTLSTMRVTNPSIAIASIRSETPYRTHIGAISRFFSNSQVFNIDLSDEENKRQTLNRLLYRSRQRGYLELDLVFRNWVEDNISSMDEARIKALIDVLDLENPDLWKWLTGQEQPPENVDSNPVFLAVRDKVMGNLNNHASPDTRAAPGKPWVRGWDDYNKKGQDGPKYGNQ